MQIESLNRTNAKPTSTNQQSPSYLFPHIQIASTNKTQEKKHPTPHGDTLCNFQHRLHDVLLLIFNYNTSPSPSISANNGNRTADISNIYSNVLKYNSADLKRYICLSKNVLYIRWCGWKQHLKNNKMKRTVFVK